MSAFRVRAHLTMPRETETETTPMRVCRTIIHILQRVAQDNDDRIAAQKHFRDEAILVDWLRPCLAFLRARHLGPHLLHGLEHHVAVAIECLDSREKLAVVAARNQDLRDVMIDNMLR